MMPRPPQIVKGMPVAVWLVSAAAVIASATGVNISNDPVTGEPLFGTQLVVSTAANHARSVAVGEFNGDGHLDLASASWGDNKIAWYNNTDGLGTFGTQIVVSTNASCANSVAVGDLNGDGHLDLASASNDDNKIAWYKNTDGLGTFGSQIVVSTNASGAYSVVVGDFNGDGHLDLASASFNDNKIAWYKNTNGLGTFGSQIVVSTDASGAYSVVVGDFNGDGHLDLASASANDNKIAWYKNTDGLGTFGAQTVVSTIAKGATSVAVGDFNGDGHLDLASASSDDSKIAWYQNTDGLGTFGNQIVVSTATSYAFSVAVGDFNGDGHLDLASASEGDNKIAWYKNTDGLGTFGPQIVVSTNASNAYSVAVGDFNGDGDLDLASASIKDNKIAWYKNLTPPPQCCQAQPAFPGYKDLCTNVTDKPTCLGLASGYGKTCEWTCGECDAITGDGQYQKFCLGHKNITSCSGVSSTCHWVPAN
jgi:hypothetical protein